MKKLTLFALLFILFACAPVLNRDLLKEGELNPPLDQMQGNPEAYKGKLYILGGVIVETRFIQDGSQIEVLSLPVNSKGYLEERDHARHRFFAIYPKDKGLLDPMIYKKGREVSLAGVFQGTRRSKIDDLEYTYPMFEIRQIYLWTEQAYPGPYYPYYYSRYYYPYWYNQPYWGPWGPPPPGWW